MDLFSLNTCFFPVRGYICIYRNIGRKRGERAKGKGERVGEIGKKRQRKEDIDRKGERIWECNGERERGWVTEGVRDSGRSERGIEN